MKMRPNANVELNNAAFNFLRAIRKGIVCGSADALTDLV